MKKEDFITQFQFNQLGKTSKECFRYRASTKSSAVLVALIEREGLLHVVLTKRSLHLKHHPGQISFPGGKVDKSDINPQATALRESEEEIGLAKTAVNILGQLPQYHTISGFEITPVVALLDSKSTFKQNDDEVSEIFFVPLQHFLNSSNHIAVRVLSEKNTYPVYFMPYLHYNIWGATAAILKDLSYLLTNKVTV